MSDRTVTSFDIASRDNPVKKNEIDLSTPAYRASQLVGDTQWPLAVRGTKAAIYTQGGLAIYDSSTPTTTLVKEVNLRGYGYTSFVLLGDDHAVASLGEYGLQTIRF